MPERAADVARGVSGSVRRTWSRWRHLMAIRGTLDLLGVWGILTSTASSILLGVWTRLEGWSWPIVIAIMLGVWACVATIWRASRGAAAPPVIDPQTAAARWRAISQDWAALAARDPGLHVGWSRTVDTGATAWFLIGGLDAASRDACRARAEEAGAQLRHTPGFATAYPAIVAEPDAAARWYATVQVFAPTPRFTGRGSGPEGATVGGSLDTFAQASERACVRLAALAMS